MKWYEKFSQIVNSDFYTNYMDFFKKETGQEELELFWEKLYECSTEWEQKYHLYARRYHLYGVKGDHLDVEIDEFVFDENIEKQTPSKFSYQPFDGVLIYC